MSLVKTILLSVLSAILFILFPQSDIIDESSSAVVHAVCSSGHVAAMMENKTTYTSYSVVCTVPAESHRQKRQ